MDLQGLYARSACKGLQDCDGMMTQLKNEIKEDFKIVKLKKMKMN